MLLAALAAALLAGCTKKADSAAGLLGVAELKLRLDFDRFVVKPASGNGGALANAFRRVCS